MDFTLNPPPETLRQKILLVDDLQDNLVMLEQLIRPLNVEIFKAEDGAAALALVLQHSFSVIILDVVMPGMDGYALAKKIKDRPETREVPIIFITGIHQGTENILEGYEAGAIDFILKPYVPEVITRKVKVLLEIDRKIHALEQQRADLKQREADRIRDLAISQKSLQASRQNALDMMQDAQQAKRLAEENAERYRCLFENLPIGFSLHEMIYDEAGRAVDYRFIQINPAFETFTGLKGEDVIGKTMREVLPDTEAYWIDLYAKVVETGETAFYENHEKTLGKYYNVRAYRQEPGRFAVLFSDVTEQREMAEQLQITQFAVEHLQDAVYLLDLAGRFTYVNHKACEELGYSKTELLKLQVWDIDTRMTAENWPATLEDIKGHGGVVLEGEQMRKNGTRFPVEVKTNFLTVGGNEWICGFAHNITESKQMREAIEKQIVALTRPLEDSEEISFEELFNIKDIQRIQDEFASATNVASIITQPDGTPITRPSNFTDLCGKVIRSTEKGCANCMISDAKIGRGSQSGPIIQPCLSGGLWDAGASINVGGKHIASWLIGQVRDETQTDEAMLAYAREIGADETRFLDAFHRVPQMSREHFDHISSALYTLANQLSTSAYQNVQQARFIAEEKRRTKELQRLSTALEQSPEVIVITDTDGIIEYTNPAFEKTTGYSCAEAIGKKPSLVKSHIHDEDFYRQMWQTISAGNIWTGRMINQRKDGTQYTEDVVISPVKSSEGTITNYVAVKRDITHELLQEERMLKAQKMEAVGQLAGGIAHDFNNILQSIMGFSDLLNLTLSESMVQPRGHVQEIQKAAQHAAELTRQLLAFSRKQHVHFSTINLNETLLKTLNFINSIIGENIRVVTDLSQELHPVHADASQLERAFLNMAINARDAMPRGGVLTLATENITFTEPGSLISPHAHPGDYVCLRISDTGTGIPPDIMDRIFEPFFTTKPIGSGTGLGLAATYGIIRKHNGWIDVASTPGEGTTFNIYLPAVVKQSKPLPVNGFNRPMPI